MSVPILDARRPWQRRPGGAAALLAPLGLLYGLGAALDGRWRARRPVACKKPVIVVGNLEAGGTGKTPAVLALAALLLESGRRPGLVTGLWGASARGHRLLSREDPAFPPSAPDEARLLAARLPDIPLVAARRKWEGAQRLDADEACDLILVDDGFQHRRLVRDLDLVRLSRDCPLSPWRVLPAGPLREFPRALARTGAYLLAPGQSPPAAWPAPVLILERVAERLQTLDGEAASPWPQGMLTAAAIARPEGFEASATRLLLATAPLLAHLRFPDHADWSPALRARLAGALARWPEARFLVTEKDAQRWASSWDLPGPPPLVLALEHRFRDPAAVLALLP